MKKIYRSPKKKQKKLSTLAICLLLTVVFGVCGTLAYIFTSTGTVTNTFSPPDSDITVEEDWDPEIGLEKKDVTVRNTGDYPIYVRAALVIAWENQLNTIHSTPPILDKEYTLVLNDEDWFKGADGFYYYKTPVMPGAETKALVVSAKVLLPGPEKDGETYYLSVNILAQGIQAVPTDAVVDAWGVTLGGTDGTTITGPVAADNAAVS